LPDISGIADLPCVGVKPYQGWGSIVGSEYFGKRQSLRRAFAVFASFIVFLGLLAPAMVAAQTQSATPIAPGDLETNTDESLGTQSVVFARFDQSSDTSTPGGTVDLTLTVTSTASTTGAIAIPEVPDLTFTLTDAHRTENMATCNATPDGSGGISASYSLVTGTGTCAISFTAQLSATASGTLTVAATVSENGSLASSPTTTISVPSASLFASFEQSSYSVKPGDPVSVSLHIEMTGPVTGGQVNIPNPLTLPPTLFGDPEASLSSGVDGTCTATLDSSAITGSFSVTDPGTSATCTITFDVTVTGVLPVPIMATYFSTEFPLSNVANTLLDPSAAPAPLVTFNLPVYVVPQGTSTTGFATVGDALAGASGEVTIASDYATISDPVVTGSVPGASCSVAEAGDAVTVTYSQPGVQLACIVSFVISVDPAEPVASHPDGITALPAPYIASLEVTMAPLTDVTAAFDQATYSGTVGGTIDMQLDITIPAGQEVTGGAFTIPAPPGLIGSSFSGATATSSNLTEGNCELPPIIVFPVSTISGTFDATGAAEVTCTISMTLSIVTAPITTSSSIVATVSSLETGLISPSPSALVTVTVPQALSISLSSPTAAPGEQVTVTVTQYEAITFLGPGTINSVVPDGVTYDDSVPPTIACDPSINCVPPLPPLFNGTTVSASYSLIISTDPNTTITMQYVVTVDAPIGTSIEFGASGMTSTLLPTFAEPVTLLVQGDAPEATDFDLVVEAGGSVSGSLANHIASDNGIATYASDLPTGDGSFTVNPATGDFTYTAGSTPGTDSIGYTITDTVSLTDSGTISVTIIEPLETSNVDLNAMPADTVTYDLNNAVSGGQPPHTFTPANESLTQGDISIDEDGQLTYTANNDASGSDTFIYDVIDGLGLPDSQVTSAAVGSGTITITIIQPMTVEPVTITLAPGATVTFDLNEVVSGGLPPYTFTLLGQPEQGSASIDTNGILTVNADADATGSETILFQIMDNYGNTAITSAATATGAITLNYSDVPTATATATSPDDPTATATSPDGPTATATSPDGPTATTPAGITPTNSAGGGPLPGNPNATATATSTPSPTSGTGSNGGVTQLPSTGTGDASTSPALLWTMLLLSLAMCGSLGIIVRRRNRAG